MEEDKIDWFDKEGQELFKFLVEDLGYVMSDKKIDVLNGKKWSVKHTYTNNKLKLKIEISQAPYYTDYGFSFFLSNLKKGEQSLLYHVPHERQDKNGQFLAKASRDLLTTKETFDLISGKTWRQLRSIPFQL